MSNSINERIVPVPDYAPDPRGTGMFDHLAAVGQTGIDGSDGLVYVGDRGSPEVSFNGDLDTQLQGFTGEAALAMYGAAQPIRPGAATLANAHAVDALNDAPARIFAARAARRAALG